MRFRKSRLYISALLPMAIGFFVGILSAIMGVGGGFILVPAMIYLLGMPTAVVVGTSLFQIIFVAANVTFLQAVQNQTVDVVLALVLTGRRRDRRADRRPRRGASCRPSSCACCWPCWSWRRRPARLRAGVDARRSLFVDRRRRGPAMRRLALRLAAPIALLLLAARGARRPRPSRSSPISRTT